ncbi:hypothetical protein [Oryzomicrobium sp.]|uniref:hypothetical protein n=1 Tax=Oryzomicrobium sp. TaxID=1911578 RepID=UPI0025DA695B|nr:hypothetical protein [Oryzomicrobium sp.]MCE1242525.1 hypothetical protein [Oryzomicrobium sp.]
MHGLTRGDLDISPQKLCNWRSQGVAKPVMIDIASIIGCKGKWLKVSMGGMVDMVASPDDAMNSTGSERKFELATIMKNAIC